MEHSAWILSKGGSRSNRGPDFVGLRLIRKQPQRCRKSRGFNNMLLESCVLSFNAVVISSLWRLLRSNTCRLNSTHGSRRGGNTWVSLWNNGGLLVTLSPTLSNGEYDITADSYFFPPHSWTRGPALCVIGTSYAMCMSHTPRMCRGRV